MKKKSIFFLQVRKGRTPNVEISANRIYRALCALNIMDQGLTSFNPYNHTNFTKAECNFGVLSPINSEQKTHSLRKLPQGRSHNGQIFYENVLQYVPLTKMAFRCILIPTIVPHVTCNKKNHKHKNSEIF